MLYLHGGPGIATLDVVPRALRGKSWPLFRRQHDLVFFDMRGTGRSTPAICPDFDRTLAALAAQGRGVRASAADRLAAARACRKELQSLSVDPASYNASSIAADVEALRTALRVDRWNIFATSFGSLPAAQILRKWPNTVRALILDSAFPPNSPNRAEQIGATAASFRAYQRQCDRLAPCRALFPNLRSAAVRIARRLDRVPIVTSTGRITGESFRDALWRLMVDGSTARYLPELLRRAGQGDNDLIRRFAAVYGAPGYFGGYADAQAWLINCHDSFPRPSRLWLDRAVAANGDLAGEVVRGHQDAMCNTLQPSHAEQEFYQPLVANVPSLILFGEFDPATPRIDALTAREFFRGATLIEIEGASHAPFYTDECSKGIALAFIARPDAVVDQSCLADRPSFAFADGPAFDEFLRSLPN
jgi:pimeloyl-ACP methyl ester carboxylesterase